MAGGLKKPYCGAMTGRSHERTTRTDKKASGHQKKIPSRRSNAATLARPSEVSEYSKDSLSILYTATTRRTGRERANLVKRGLSYSEAVASLELKLENDDLRFPNGFWANKDLISLKLEKNIILRKWLNYIGVML
jgi:hypothetical protein